MYSERIMLIEKAEMRHVEGIVAVERQCFSHSWSKASVMTELEAEHSVGFVVEMHEKTVGFCLLSVIAGEASVLRIAVLPEYRRCGIGNRLLKAALNEAKNRDAEQAFLEVRAENEAAKQLYRSLGFQEFSIRKGYYRDGEDAVMMRLFLKTTE